MKKINLFELLMRPPVRFVEKPWGSELWFANDEQNNYCGKILTINKGHRFSMHFHDIKCETFFVLEGKLNVWLLDTTDASVHDGILLKGGCLDLDRLVPHEVEAIEDSKIIEVSTYHREEDSYRVWRR